MGEHHRHVGKRLGEGSAVPHLRGEDLKLEDETVLRHQRDVLAQRRVVHHRRPVGEAVLLILVPMELHADAAQQRVLALCFKDVPNVGIAQVGVADDGVGVSGAVGLGLHPGDLVDGPCGRPVGLHIDRLRNTAALDVAQIFLDGIVAPDRLIGAEDARQHRPLEPRQVLPAPDVVVRVDDPVHSGPHGGPRRLPAPERGMVARGKVDGSFGRA